MVFGVADVRKLAIELASTVPAGLKLITGTHTNNRW